MGFIERRKAVIFDLADSPGQIAITSLAPSGKIVVPRGAKSTLVRCSAKLLANTPSNQTTKVWMYLSPKIRATRGLSTIGQLQEEVIADEPIAMLAVGSEVTGTPTNAALLLIPDTLNKNFDEDDGAGISHSQTRGRRGNEIQGWNWYYAHFEASGIAVSFMAIINWIDEVEDTRGGKGPVSWFMDEETANDFDGGD